jgi:hypothetical protein
MALASALNLQQTAMALPPPSGRNTNVTVVQPRMRYNAELRELNFVALRFGRPSVVVIDSNIPESLTGENTAAHIAPFKQQFTTALSDIVTWDDRSLHATFSALSEDYDVAATEELSLSASKHFGW